MSRRKKNEEKQKKIKYDLNIEALINSTSTFVDLRLTTEYILIYSATQEISLSFEERPLTSYPKNASFDVFFQTATGLFTCTPHCLFRYVT